MTEQELYKYYYDNYTRDINDLLNNKVKSRLYIGPTSKQADKFAAESLPEDEWSRNIIARAAKDALKNSGYDYSDTGLYNNINLTNNSNPRRWTPVKDYKMGNSIAYATLNKLRQPKKPDERTGIINPQSLKQNPIDLANSMLTAIKSGQPIDSLIALVPESPDDLYKSAFIYTLASQYPAKTPEVAKEMQTLAARHKINASKWEISQKPKLNMNDLLATGGFRDNKLQNKEADK